MEKLFYENPYIREFTAEIIDIIQIDNEYHVELDKTCFYPEGGGQPSDTGYIEAAPVKYVYGKDDKIYHVVQVKPNKIHRVKCSINWERRFDHMQQHLGQHIISAFFAELFNANTIGFHLGENYSSIDLDKLIGSPEIKEVEKMANKLIQDNIKVEILYPTDRELKKMPLRKALPKTNEKIRIVKIGDLDINACCGTHPYTTIEVMLIKITRLEKYKNGSRLEFLCGQRAISDYLTKHEAIERISSILSCGLDGAANEIERLKGDLNKALSEKRALQAEVTEYEVKDMLNSCENINGKKILKSIYDEADLKRINSIASKLTSYPNVIVLFGVRSKDKAHLIFMRSRDLNIIDMNSLLKDAITLIDGKGGGSAFQAQGGGKNNNNLDSSIEYAYNKIKSSLM